MKQILIELDGFMISIHFFDSFQFDPSAILDFLISDRPEFLRYFTLLLKLLVNNWNRFINVCHKYDEKYQKAEEVLAQFMSCLIRLRMNIGNLFDKGLYPYNPSVLLKRMAQLENLYEK